MAELTDADVAALLARPLVARVATNGPTVRPVWFLWEDAAFWWLTGDHAGLPRLLRGDPRVAVVVDTCDLATGEVLEVTATGSAEQHPYDAARARRKLTKYLGPDERHWDRERFGIVAEGGEAEHRLWFVRLAPERLTARDYSYRAAPDPPVIPPGG